MTIRRHSPGSVREVSCGDHGDDRVPDEVRAQAKAVFARRAPGPLAVLLFDSAVDEDRPSVPHRLRFEHSSVSVDVAVEAHVGACSLHGRVEPGQVRVELELDGSDVTLAEPGEGGQFTFNRVPTGVMRLRLLERWESNTVRTDWFRA